MVKAGYVSKPRAHSNFFNFFIRNFKMRYFQLFIYEKFFWSELIENLQALQLLYTL